MINRIFLIYLCLILILLLGQANCAAFAQTKKVKFGETFTLKTNEAVETEDGKLKVQSKGAGRTISESGEFEYVELQVWFNKSEQRIEISERGAGTKTVGDYVIELVDAESFGETNCQLKISRKK